MYLLAQKPTVGPSLRTRDRADHSFSGRRDHRSAFAHWANEYCRSALTWTLGITGSGGESALADGNNPTAEPGARQLRGLTTTPLIQSNARVNRAEHCSQSQKCEILRVRGREESAESCGNFGLTSNWNRRPSRRTRTGMAQAGFAHWVIGNARGKSCLSCIAQSGLLWNQVKTVSRY